MTSDYYIKHLQLLPHPEGGYYKETYRSQNSIILKDFGGSRNYSTAIYFLLEEKNFSAFHKIKSDEMWHFYGGDTLEVIEINLEGDLKITSIGKDLEKGETLQHVVPANIWFASRVKQGGKFSLVGCTVSPGFDFADFEMAKRNELIKTFPKHSEIIEELTRS
jgi:predicted cupin superfamily sugar epimerase